MLTPFGKATRRYRDEVGVTLKEMAEFLEVPSSYLSALEHGQKKVSEKVIEKTFQFFGEEGPTLDVWADLAAASPTHIKLDLTSASQLEREVYSAVGRSLRKMPAEIQKEIRDLIRKHDDEVP